MTSHDIEMLGVIGVQELCIKSGYLTPYINENDKEPSWDGEIYIYEKDNKTTESFYGKVAVQVKGVCKDDLSQNTIKYDVDVADLKAYQKNGGIIYMVTYVSADLRKKVYYLTLPPVKLIEILKNCSNQRTKRLDFRAFPNNNKKIVNVLMNFFNNCRRQRSFTDKTMISVDELKKKGIGNLTSSVVGFGYDPNDFYSPFLENEIFFYCKKNSDNVELPILMTPQNISIAEKRETIVTVDGVEYYNNITLKRTKESTLILIGKSVSFPLIKNNVSWNEFEENLGKLRWELCLNNVEKIYDHEGYFDFSQTDSLYSIQASYCRESNHILRKFFRDWISYINDLIPKKSFLNKFNKIFTNKDKYLTFNYTNTLETLYGIQNVCHIHGDISKWQELVMGHSNSSYLDKEYMDYEYNAYCVFREIYNSYIKDTKKQMVCNHDFFDSIKGVEEVYLYGLSLGTVDFPYYRYLFHICTSIKKIYLYNYEQNEFHKNVEKLKSCGAQSRIHPWLLNNDDITATVNGEKYVKNSVLQLDGLYSFILTDYAGNQSHYTVTIDTICPAYNFDKLNKLQRNITLWYIASIDGADYSFATYNEALAFACDKEFEKNVTVLNLDNIDDFNQHHLVAGNTEIRLGEYWLYKSKTNADILLYYFDKTLLKEAISYYAKNFVSDKNHFENNGSNRYGITAESMSDNLCCSIDGMSVPFVNDFVFDCYDSVKIFAELADGNGTKIQLAYGCKFSEQINVGGLYKITEIDAAENVKVYYCYYDSFAPTLNVEAKIYGDNAPTNLSVSQDGLQGISAYFYESFSIKEIVDADKWTVVTVENNNIKKHFTYGEELPRLIIGGEYQLTVYDRFNNTYSFTVYIVGNPATITFRNNNDDSIFTLSIALEQSFDTIVSLEILRNGETVSGVTTDKLSYEFCDNGIYLVRLKDNFGRVVTSEYSFNVIVEDTVAPTITLRGVTNGGRTKKPVVIDELSEQANVEVYKDGQLIEYKLGDELSLYGEYVVVITDLANNVSTYCFTIAHSLNLGSILIIVLSVLILLSAIIAVILIRKIGIFGKRKNFKSDSNSVKKD